jgi:NOL1/NOP2/fmu family ribosome biogenesis protein
MNKIKILNSREIKEISRLLSDQWGCSDKLDYVFLMNERSRIFITNRDFSLIDTKKIRINSIGLYFGELMDNDRLRLSIEGSQIIGPRANKNVVLLNEAETQEWLRGNCVEKNCEDGLVIIRTPVGYAGCGAAKDGKILNYVPKTRRIK